MIPNDDQFKDIELDFFKGKYVCDFVDCRKMSNETPFTRTWYI